jgi:hypothetical protein
LFNLEMWLWIGKIGSKCMWWMFRVFWRFKFLVLGRICCTLFWTWVVIGMQVDMQTIQPRSFLLLLPLIWKLHFLGSFMCVLSDLDFECVFCTSKCCKCFHLCFPCCNVVICVFGI